MSLKKNYISPQNANNLITYKYSGSDLSLLYKHFFSPIAQFLVDRIIPEWMAPNLITLMGFVCTLVPHIIILAAFPNTLSGNVPNWMCLLAGIGQLTYMILDNADGKQARKTGSSSPLGLLFDHGCDAMNTFISGLNLFTVLQLGNSFWSLWGFIICFATFFMATWEEYYVEALNLPCFNGANEGIVGVAFLFIATGIFGTDIWNTTIAGAELKYLVVAGFTVMAVVTAAMNLMTVKKMVGQRFGEALCKLNMIFYLIITIIIVYEFSPTNTVSRTARYLIYFIGLSFAKLVGILQASHCSHQEFDQYSKSILISTSLLNAFTLVGYLTGSPLVDEDSLIYGLAAFALVAHIHFILNVVSQFTQVLRIRVFKIGKMDLPLPVSFDDEDELLNIGNLKGI
jgi:ethanolaminephosphotransferase